MSLPISFDPHRTNRSLGIPKSLTCEPETDFTCSSRLMSICAASVQVVGPHAMLRIVLSAIVTGELSSRGAANCVLHTGPSFPRCNVGLVSQVPLARSALPRERFRSMAQPRHAIGKDNAAQQRASNPRNRGTGNME